METKQKHKNMDLKLQYASLDPIKFEKSDQIANKKKNYENKNFQDMSNTQNSYKLLKKENLLTLSERQLYKIKIKQN